MNTKTLLTAIPLALLLAACGGANNGNNGQSADVKGEISKNRTTAFKSMMPEFSSMGKMVKGEETYNVDTFKELSAKFVVSSKKPFEFFQNDPQGNGDALPNIWQQADKFKAEQDKFLAAVEKLNASAQTGNLDEIKAAYGEAGASCKSCHDTFRRPK